MNGIVRADPLAGLAVRLVAPAGWQGAEGERRVDGEGRVDWTLTCTAPSPSSLRIVAGQGELTVAAPFCREPDRGAPPPEDDQPQTNFPVGSSFTPPFGGPLPAGRYEVTETSGTCALVYEVWDGAAWSDERVTNTSTLGLTLDTFARNLETLGDTPPCTYRRVS
jgi:hypothetical protein